LRHGLLWDAPSSYVSSFIYNVRCEMKVVQTELNDAEYKLLADYARKRGKTIKEAIREATLNLILSDTVHPDDPLFTEPHLVKGTGKKERTSVEHDKLLYGVTR